MTTYISINTMFNGSRGILSGPAREIVGCAMTTYVSINTRFNGSRAILSGPAGGVVGYAMTTYEDQPVIGFDMGGRYHLL